ncbi:MlaD family protein [Nocardia sp. NPDC059228]|uniref:MlaD family protein n=1 Tax=Nocardia sp. NPDC059228 TaxID=3346777 RepID=UPI0036AA712F
MSLGSIVLVLVLGVAYMVVGVLQFEPRAEFTTVRMLLANSGGVAPNTPVLLTGVEVGKVTAVTKAASGVEIALRIDHRYQVPVSSAVRVEDLSALGEPYIEFEPSSKNGPYLSNNQVLNTRNVTEPTSIPQLSHRLVELVGQLDPKAINSIVTTFDQGLADTDTAIPTLERSTKLLAATLLSRTDTIKQALVDSQTIGGDMAWVGPGLAETGPKWTGFGTLIDRLIVEGSKFFEAGNAPQMYETGDGLLPFVAALTAFLNKVGPSMAELTPVVTPLATVLNGVGGQFDISTLISQAVSTVGDDGALHLQLNVK